MLLFKFEGQDTATRKDLTVAWTPLVLLDFAIVEYLFGMVLWYAEKNNEWRTAMISSQLAFLLGFCVWLSFWMWSTMSGDGGLGEEEMIVAARGKRAADS